MSRMRWNSPFSVHTNSFGSMPDDVSSICLKTESSFRWLRILFWASSAESNRPMPGYLTPFNLLASFSSSIKSVLSEGSSETTALSVVSVSEGHLRYFSRVPFSGVFGAELSDRARLRFVTW